MRIAFILLLMYACQTQPINQYQKSDTKSKLRHGKWIEDYDIEGGKLTAKGKYDNGEKIGVWKTYFGEKLYQKEKIKNGISQTKFYYPNGKIMERGQSKTIISENGRIWHYFGDWKYYDANGKLKYIKKYADGNKVDSINISQKR
ncbi:MAG: hypothetical protein Q4G16_03905 [Cruoricaptor ignavus]|nr:hypothetical protein [Cruoricaptor ignavus]